MLFLYSDIGTYLPRHYQHGIGFLSSSLKSAGHETGLLYVQHTPDTEELISRVESFGPQLLALSANTNQFHHLRAFAGVIRDALPDIPIVCGGAHATMAPEQVLREPAIDFVCRGESEQALLELVEAVEQKRDPSDIKNIWLKSRGDIVRNPVRRLEENLDSLPFADRDIFDYEDMIADDYHRVSVLAGRGCPYKCSYCSNAAKMDMYRGAGKYVRRRTVENLLAEIRMLVSGYHVERLHFDDDIFTLDRQWAEAFCKGYAREFSLPFEVNAHVETLDEKLIEKLAEAGCDMICIGVESGSDKVRNKIMNRPISREKIIEVFRHADRAGIRTWSFNMVGLPGETPKDAEQTYDLNRELEPDHMQVSVFHPYPGTELYKVCEREGYITSRQADGYFTPETVLDMPGFSREKIYEWHRKLIRLSDVSKNAKRLKRELGDKGIQVDIIERLEKAEIETPVPSYVGEDYFTIGEDVRRVLLEHPPSVVRYRIKLPRKARLKFGIAIHPGVLGKPGGDGVVFTIKAAGNLRGMKTVFERALDAKRDIKDRGWHDYEIDLRGLAGKKAWLEFSTATRDPERTDYNTAGWSNPVILGEA